jgi:hypothetical protein
MYQRTLLADCSSALACMSPPAQQGVGLVSPFAGDREKAKLDVVALSLQVVHGVVKALRDTLVASSQGVGLQQRAVDWLKERGHTGVRPLCSDTLKDDEGIPRAQIDAGATAERCAVIVVMKPRFTKSYVQAAKDTFDGIK